MNHSLVFDLATGTFIARREDALFLGHGGSGKSHLAQAIGQAAILQGVEVLSVRITDHVEKSRALWAGYFGTVLD